MEEIPELNLTSYLTQIKNEGYSVVGVEQSDKSVSLGDFKFPKKSVLVLGREREGIPAELMRLLDYVIEIPQYGVIRYVDKGNCYCRSLNVHVSGALAIWEYSKQMK